MTNDMPRSRKGKLMKSEPVEELPDALTEWLSTELPNGEVRIGSDPSVMPEPDEQVMHGPAPAWVEVDEAQAFQRQDGFLMPGVTAGPGMELPPEAYDDSAELLDDPRTAEEAARSDLLAWVEHVVNQDRPSQYGASEDVMETIAGLWTMYLRVELSTFDVAALMALMKIARIRSNPTHVDSWADLIGYGALGGGAAVVASQETDTTEED